MPMAQCIHEIRKYEFRTGDIFLRGRYYRNGFKSGRKLYNMVTIK